MTVGAYTRRAAAGAEAEREWEERDRPDIEIATQARLRPKAKRVNPKLVCPSGSGRRAFLAFDAVVQAELAEALMIPEHFLKPDAGQLSCFVYTVGGSSKRVHAPTCPGAHCGVGQ